MRYLLAVIALLLLPAPALAATVVGTGSLPGLQVDAAGTGHLAWIEGSGDDRVLRYCRVPRGASACDGGAPKTVATSTGDLVNRVKVVVDGASVMLVHSLGPQETVWTSADGGSTFDAGRPLGTVPAGESVVGPGASLSAVRANGSSLSFQNMPLDTTTTQVANLPISGKPYEATIGLLDGAMPVVVYRSVREGYDGAAFTRYDGSGALNDAGNWTPSVDLGPLYYPQLAGGPRGLVLLGCDQPNPLAGASNIISRRYDGTSFGAPVALGTGNPFSLDATQDATGRTHAVWERSPNVETIEIHHAATDDGVAWRSGVLESLSSMQYSGLGNTTVSLAPDQVGMMAASANGGIGFLRLGPDVPATAAAPATPPAPPPATAPAGPSKPTLEDFGARLVRRLKKFELTVAGRVVARRGDPPLVCPGTVKLTLLKGKRAVRRWSVRTSNTCIVTLERKIALSRVGGRMRLRVSAAATKSWLAFAETRKVRVRS